MRTFYAEIIRKREAGGVIVLQGRIVKAPSKDSARDVARRMSSDLGGLGVRGVYPITAAWARQLVADDQAV